MIKSADIPLPAGSYFYSFSNMSSEAAENIYSNYLIKWHIPVCYIQKKLYSIKPKKELRHFILIFYVFDTKYTEYF